jgi:transcriptional regulator with XRE-family HTH domain
MGRHKKETKPIDPQAFAACKAAGGWTNAQLAQRLGISLSTLRNYLRAGRIPVDIWDRFCELSGYNDGTPETDLF